MPAYEARFLDVLKFHPPGLAAVRDESGAFHIDINGRAAYRSRFRKTFGFYEGRASVEARDDSGWLHVLATGEALYNTRFAWCGNFQCGRSPVRDNAGRYCHLRLDGTPAYAETWRYAGDYRDGIAVVQRDDGRHTHVDLQGRPVHDHWFIDLDVFHKGFARARDEGGWHHVDDQGNAAYAHRFAAVEPFYNGQARVEGDCGELWVIDESGETLVVLRHPLRSPLQALSSDLVGVWKTQTIRSAVRLGIFEILPTTSIDLEQHASLAPSMGERLLRALSELGLVERSASKKWIPTERGRLLRREPANSLAAASQIWGEEHAMAWAHLFHSLRSGESAFEKEFGAPYFDWLATRAPMLATYQEAMRSYAHHDYAHLPSVVALDGTVVVDAGGGSGELLLPLLRANPRARGVLLDRPEVIAPLKREADPTSRIEFVGADLFGPWPVRPHAVFLARVIHDWNDERAVAILQRAHEALAPGGQLFVVELILDEERPNGGLLDLNMLVMTGGRERTLRDFGELLNASGFNLVVRRELPAGSVSSVLEARRR